jgi:hypothetical protein
MNDATSSPGTRLGVALAAAVGLALAMYFVLEADGTLANVFGPRTESLADIFTERGRAHSDPLAGARVRVYAFAAILVVSLVTASGRTPPHLCLAYPLCAYILPGAMVVETLVQPFTYGAFCVPCLITVFPALLMLELKGPALEDLAAFKLRSGERVSPKPSDRLRND